MSDATPAAPPAPPEPPKGLLEKLGAALPVGLTALATIFASMSNGALQEAMYWKSQAAQDQSRSTNQWTLAGFKRDRALIMQATAAQLRAASGYAAAGLVPGPGGTGSDVQLTAGKWLTETKPEQGGLPAVRLPEIEDPLIKELREAIERRESEQDLLRRAARVDKAKLNKAIDDAEKYAEQVDKDWEPVLKTAADLVRAKLAFKSEDPEADKKAKQATAAQAAGFDLEERRYRAESRLNQGIGFLYEIRTKVSAAESDKYRRKSDFLSAAMLVAQIGAVASSLALARKQKSALWLFAGIVGVIAIGVGGYAIIPVGLLF